MTGNIPTIPQFYCNKSVLITGGTGFMGKALVEKLLRTCPGIKKIYLLIRKKNEQAVDDRLDQILSNPVFEKLTQEDLEKIIPIEGDVSLPNLGLSHFDQTTLTDEVSIVFHTAATVRFNESLNVAINVNVKGTKRLIELCKGMKNIKCFVYVSTAYSNNERDEVDEVLYSPDYDYENIIGCLEWMDKSLVKALTDTYVSKKQNTYAYSKFIAENVVANEAKGIPRAVVRPSMVLSTWKDPFPGWIDNVYGPTSVILACGIGFFRSAYANKTSVADFIPIDVVINSLIAASWRCSFEDDVSFYNCCCSSKNQITWGRFVEIFLWYSRKFPFENIVWYPDTSVYSNQYLIYIFTWTCQVLPLKILETVSRCLGGNIQLLKFHDKVFNFLKDHQLFASKEWVFRDGNLQKLNRSLLPDDSKIFCCTAETVDWFSYIGEYFLGIRRIILKQKDSTIAASQRKCFILKIVHKFLQISVVHFIFKFLLRVDLLKVLKMCLRMVVTPNFLRPLTAVFQ